MAILDTLAGLPLFPPGAPFRGLFYAFLGDPLLIYPVKFDATSCIL